MINGSFVFGMDDDDDGCVSADGRLGDRQRHHDGHLSHPDAVSRHRSPSRGWSRKGGSSRTTGICTTRAMWSTDRRGLHPQRLKEGYDWAYREFYRWRRSPRASFAHGSVKHQAKHFFYAAGWKKFEAAWNLVIRARQLQSHDAASRGRPCESQRPALRCEGSPCRWLSASLVQRRAASASALSVVHSFISWLNRSNALAPTF